MEIPSHYKIVFPGNGPPGGPSYVTILPVKINNRGNVLFWQDTAPYGGTQLFRRNNGSPSFLVLPGLDADKPNPSTNANADPGDVRDTSLETYFTSPIEAVGTSRRVENPRRRAMSWSVAGSTISRADLGTVNSLADSVALGANTFSKAVGFAQATDGSGRVGWYKSDLSSASNMAGLSNPNYGEAVAINESGLIVGRNGMLASYWSSYQATSIPVEDVDPNLRSRCLSVSNSPFGSETLPRAVGCYLVFDATYPEEYWADDLDGGFIADLSGNYTVDTVSNTPSSIKDGGVVLFQSDASTSLQRNVWFPNAQWAYDSAGKKTIGGTGSQAIPFLGSSSQYDDPDGWDVCSILDVNNNNQVVGQMVDGSSPANHIGFVGTAVYAATGTIRIPVAFEGISNLDDEDYDADHPTSVLYRLYQGQVLVLPDDEDGQYSTEWMSDATLGTETIGGTPTLCATIPNIGLRGLVTVLMKPALESSGKARYLTKVVLVSATSGVVVASAATFLTGDIDRDDVVTSYDYNILSDYYDKASEDADWNTVGQNGHAPRECDLDEDGAVTVYDYNLLSANFDRQGDVY